MRFTIGPEKRTRSLHGQLPDVHTRTYFKRAVGHTFWGSFIPLWSRLLPKIRTARHVGYWLVDTTVRRYFACERTPGERTRGRARSRFDPRMIIRRQVISGSRYMGGVMGKTVTLLSYPLWIHSIRLLFACLSSCIRALHRSCISVYMHVSHALGVGSRSFHVFTSVDLSSGQNITRIHNGLVGPSTNYQKHNEIRFRYQFCNLT